MITIPLEIGDLILAGKFKNKKIIVKEIGYDEYGLPTVNGRGIMKIRIAKLMKDKPMSRSIKENKEYTGVEVPVRIKKIDGTFWIHKVKPSGEEVCVSKTGYETKEQAERASMLKGYVLLGTGGEIEEYEFLKPPKANDAKSADYKPKGQKFDSIEEVVRRVLREVNKKKLNELEVTDPDLENKINEMARISNEMDRLKNELAKLKKQFDPLDDMITKLMEEADAAGERALETKQVLITIKKKGNPNVEVAAYKERFERLYNRVNGTMKKQEDEWWELHRTFKKIPTTLGIQYKESVLKESGRFKQFIDKVKGFFTKMYAKIFSTGKQVESAVEDFKQFVGQ